MLAVNDNQTPFYFKQTGLSCLNNFGPLTFGLTEVGVVKYNVGKRINVDSGVVATLTIPRHTRPYVPRDVSSDPWIVNYVSTFISKHGLKSEIQKIAH